MYVVAEYVIILIEKYCWRTVVCDLLADYQGLEGSALVEEYRRQILCTFRAYTTGLIHNVRLSLSIIIVASISIVCDVSCINLFEKAIITSANGEARLCGCLHLFFGLSARLHKKYGGGI